jgi:FkbM family methyltransferase
MKINLFNKLGKYIILLKEANGLKSKLSLLLYAPFVPFYYCTTAFHNAFLFDVTMKNENGMLFCGKSLVAIHTAASFHEKYLKDYMKIDDGTFVDIGANIGKYTVFMARKLAGKGRVLAIEPEPDNFAVLAKNIFLNRMYNNITAIDKACSDKEESAILYLQKKGSGSHSLYRPKKCWKEIRVRTMKLDDIVERLKIENIRLIKIDVEGAEAEVLRGAEKVLGKFHPDIIFESEKNIRQCSEILSPLGYHVLSLPEFNHFAHYFERWQEL